MAREMMQVGIVVERRRLTSPWAEFAWMPVAVLPGAPAALPWTLLGEENGTARYYAGAFQMEFFSSETANYRDNLRSGRPGLWVALRQAETPPGMKLQAVTADPAEGEALTEPGTDVVEVVPMPAEIFVRLAAFVQTHHVEREFFKRRRDRADPEALAVRPAGLSAEEAKE